MLSLWASNELKSICSVCSACWFTTHVRKMLQFDGVCEGMTLDSFFRRSPKTTRLFVALSFALLKRSQQCLARTKDESFSGLKRTGRQYWPSPLHQCTKTYRNYQRLHQYSSSSTPSLPALLPFRYIRLPIQSIIPKQIQQWQEYRQIEVQSSGPWWCLRVRTRWNTKKKRRDSPLITARGKACSYCFQLWQSLKTKPWTGFKMMVHFHNREGRWRTFCIRHAPWIWCSGLNTQGIPSSGVAPLICWPKTAYQSTGGQPSQKDFVASHPPDSSLRQHRLCCTALAWAWCSSNSCSELPSL